MNHSEIKLPAIRSQMGIWVYYLSSLSFKEVKEYVSPIDNELHQSEFLCQMIQRSITDNYKAIANYLSSQDERFFNALILAVYNGQPIWNEIRVDDLKSEITYNLGVLTLTGEEKIFPVDGQHRVAGIKKVIESKGELENERVPVIFVGHSNDVIGMQRTRRMFSTLNRYAKPVSLRDIIALDEDDVVAIASRRLIDETNLFGIDRILDSKTKAIPDNNDRALTSIISYYECNKELLWLFIKDACVEGLDGNLVKGRKKITEYIRHRPDEITIDLFTQSCKEYWTAIIDSCNEIFETNGNVGKYRNKMGGHIFFRPAALIPFTKAIVRIKENEDVSYTQIINSIPENIKWVQNDIWKKILWDDIKKNMVMGNVKLTELIFIYAYNKALLKDSEIDKIAKELESLWDYKKDDLMELFDERVFGNPHCS